MRVVFKLLCSKIVFLAPHPSNESPTHPPSLPDFSEATAFSISPPSACSGAPFYILASFADFAIPVFDAFSWRPIKSFSPFWGFLSLSTGRFFFFAFLPCNRPNWPYGSFFCVSGFFEGPPPPSFSSRKPSFPLPVTFPAYLPGCR